MVHIVLAGRYGYSVSRAPHHLAEQGLHYPTALRVSRFAPWRVNFLLKAAVSAGEGRWRNCNSIELVWGILTM